MALVHPEGRNGGPPGGMGWFGHTPNPIDFGSYFGEPGSGNGTESVAESDAAPTIPEVTARAASILSADPRYRVLITVGSAVVISGLKARPALNSATGRVQSRGTGDRWVVRVGGSDPGTEALSIRSANLRQPVGVGIPECWDEVAANAMPRTTYMWGWRSNLEFAVKRGDSETVSIICRAVPAGQSLLDHRAEVWILAESRVLLRRATERCFLPTMLVLLNEVGCPVEHTGVAADLCLTQMRLGAGNQGMSPLLVCCYEPKSYCSDRDGVRTAMTTTTKAGLDQAALLLLRRGASPMHPAVPGMPPSGFKSMYALFMATVNSNATLVQAFLDAWPNADPTVRLDDGESAFSVAKMIDDNLAAAGVDGEHPQRFAALAVCRLLEARVTKLGGHQAATSAPSDSCKKGIKSVGRICSNVGCKKDGAKKRCERCRRVVYCNRRCQKLHWNEGGHKRHCAAAAASIDVATAAAASPTAAKFSTHLGKDAGHGDPTSPQPAYDDPDHPCPICLDNEDDFGLHAMCFECGQMYCGECNTKKIHNCPSCRAAFYVTGKADFQRLQKMLKERSPGRHTAHAQYNLGVKFAHGDGVPQNLAEATRLYRLAADQGNKNAKSVLSIMRYKRARRPTRAASNSPGWRGSRLWCTGSSSRPSSTVGPGRSSGGCPTKVGTS